MTIQQELESALADKDRFEALALVDFNQDRLLFLGLSESAAPGLQAGLDAF